jgi:hypothetical protein
MPVLDLPSRYTVGPVTHDLIYVLATMCFPKSPEKEDRLSYGLALDELLVSLTGEVSVPGDIARDFVGHVTPMRAMQKDLGHAKLRGTVAGFMLRWSVSRWRAGLRQEASKAKAASSVHEWLQTSPDRRPATSSAVESWIDEYRSAAHLWAPWQQVNDAGLNVATPDGFTALVATSNWLLIEGSQIVPLRATGSLLSVETAWRLPDTQSWSTAIWSDDLDYHDIRQHGHPTEPVATGQKS